MKTKRIFLIGKNGQLGGAIMSRAQSFGFEIFGVDKEEMDVTNPSQVEEKINQDKPDILINTSAYNNVPGCEDEPTKAMELNFLAVQNLAAACKKRNIVFVTYSTNYVFDGKKGSPYEEEDVPLPLQMYGLSKLAGEHAALSVYPEKSFVVRTCGLYGGKTGSPEKGNFVLNIMKEAEGKESIEVSSEQIVSPTYAGDLGKATLELLSLPAHPGIYHLVNEGSCSWYEFTKEIFKLAGINTKIKPVDRSGLGGKMIRPRFSALKGVKAEIKGVKLPSWQEGLRSYLNFLNLV